ncbi:nucleotidyltransferase family protein [Aquibium microcysteis]|uniref:nucleotidyltransferase family protein n=1 Tax=Aquibium microcysteis TaxID=675281 RepID=UPI001EF31E88|nr:nucleotidyltransferase domain-containing protein [Aquibium microcysteis]
MTAKDDAPIVDPMNRDTVIARLKSLEPALRDSGIVALYLYGSHARDEARPDSDLDVIVEFAPGRQRDLGSYMTPLHILKQQLPDVAIGYGTHDNIVPAYRATIESEAIRVF